MIDVVLALGGSDCEQLRSGWLAQPANAVSSLAYVVAGVWLLGRCRRAGVEHGAVLAAGVGLMAVGFGSVAYHGPQPGWAAMAHDASVAGIVLVFLAMGIGQLARGNVGAVVGVVKAAAPWMVPALVVYTAGRTGAWLCDPATLLQPHALWHLLSAAGLAAAMSELAQRTSRTPSIPAERWPGREQ
jgi:hypothetical protein